MAQMQQVDFSETPVAKKPTQHNKSTTNNFEDIDDSFALPICQAKNTEPLDESTLAANLTQNTNNYNSTTPIKTITPIQAEISPEKPIQSDPPTQVVENKNEKSQRSKKNFERLSIANQDTEGKKLLEEKKRKKLEMMKLKRQQEIDEKMAPSPIASMPVQQKVIPKKNLGSLPTSKSAHHSLASGQSISNVQTTADERKRIQQERREKAKALHLEQKNKVSNTVNPLPRSHSSHSTLRNHKISGSTGTGAENNNNNKTQRTNENVGNHDNKQTILQAIEKTCYPGPVNEKARKEATQAIHDLSKLNLNEKNEFHLIILFRSERYQYRATYRLDQENNNTTNNEGFNMIKVFGKGPKKIKQEDIKCYFSYSTGQKKFSVINGKTFGFNVAGMTIHDSFWSGLKPSKMDVKK